MGSSYVIAVACGDPSSADDGGGAGEMAVAGDGGAGVSHGGVGGSSAGLSGGGVSHNSAGEGGTPEAGTGGVSDAGSGGAVEAGSGGTVEAGSGGRAEAGTGGVEPEEVPEIPEVDESTLPEPVAEAGFIDVEGVRYRALMEYEEPNLESKSTRLFYSFVPADADAKNKPVFVFFNGGPGYTSMFLKAFGTGRVTLDADELDAAPKPNPASFTSLGNLLYIDARMAGFSYGLADDPSDEAARVSSFQKGSANPTADAADFVRVVVRVLHKIAALRNNRIVLVGESYGGARAVLMLEILTEPDGHSDAALYADPTLEAELSAHFESVFPGVALARLGRLARAKQFGWQVLIQPLVAGGAQYAAQDLLKQEKLERMAERAGMTVEELQADRCIDDRSRSRAWCEGVDAAVERTVTSPDLAAVERDLAIHQGAMMSHEDGDFPAHKTSSLTPTDLAGASQPDESCLASQPYTSLFLLNGWTAAPSSTASPGIRD